MLSTQNVSVQFGAKPLFEHVTVKFADGNRYGLIGANGCGKSTLMKVLGGELEPSTGEVVLQPGLRMGKLNQNQFGYEDERVLDVVMQGHREMWAAMVERDRIYADAEATDEDFMRAAELEGRFAQFDDFVLQLSEKREEVYNAFENRRLDRRQAGARFSAQLGGGTTDVNVSTENGSITLRESGRMSAPISSSVYSRLRGV